MLIESKFRLYLVGFARRPSWHLSRRRLSGSVPAASKQTPSWPRAHGKPALWQDVMPERPHWCSLPASLAWQAGAAPQRESVCNWILHPAHENDGAALPLHSWLGCLPRLAGGDGGDAPRWRGRLLVVVAAKRRSCCHGRRRRFVLIGADDALRQLRGAQAGPWRASGLSAACGGSGSVRHDRQ